MSQSVRESVRTSQPRKYGVLPWQEDTMDPHIRQPPNYMRRIQRHPDLLPHKQLWRRCWRPRQYPNQLQRQRALKLPAHTPVLPATVSYLFYLSMLTGHSSVIAAFRINPEYYPDRIFLVRIEISGRIGRQYHGFLRDCHRHRLRLWPAVGYKVPCRTKLYYVNFVQIFRLLIRLKYAGVTPRYEAMCFCWTPLIISGLFSISALNLSKAEPLIIESFIS